MKKSTAVLAVAAWIVAGGVFLGLSPSTANAGQACNNGKCISSSLCTFQSNQNCTFGEGWCAWTDCT